MLSITVLNLYREGKETLCTLHVRLNTLNPRLVHVAFTEGYRPRKYTFVRHAPGTKLDGAVLKLGAYTLCLELVHSLLYQPYMVVDVDTVYNLECCSIKIMIDISVTYLFF